MAAKKKSKAKSGQLIWRSGGWSGRYYVDVDGERVRVCTPLGTENKSAARIKLARLIAGEKHETATEFETFEEAARRIIPEQGTVDVDERIRRLEMYAFPSIGRTPVDKLRAGDIKLVLEGMVRKDQSRTSCSHILSFISAVLGQLWRDEILPENVAKRVRIPKTAKVDKRKRVLLTDEEIIRFVTHPELDPELRLLVLLARCVGGMRTSDLHAWDWDHIDWERGDAFIPRPKTKSGERLVLPELVLPALRAWWESCGKPEAGPVFPWRRGSKAGQRRGRMSHSVALRRALWKLGIRRAEERENDPLQVDTETTRRADFHSFRRIYNTSLARAGVNVQLAMKLAGHRRAGTHMKYVLLTEATAIPEQALPKAPSVPILKPMLHQSLGNRSGNHGRKHQKASPIVRCMVPGALEKGRVPAPGVSDAGPPMRCHSEMR